MPVSCQLESHGLGARTVEEVWGVPFINVKSRQWDHVAGTFLYGNPRCTAYSSVTCGMGDNAHGATGAACQDTVDFMEYGLRHGFPVMAWESVQQAYTVGKPLLDHFAELAVSNGYRVAYVFANAMTFGSCQDRKRLFCVYYPRDRQFNVEVPDLQRCYPTCYDAFWDMRDREVRAVRWQDSDYDGDCRLRLTDDEESVLSLLPSGWDHNWLVKYDYDRMPSNWQMKWDTRTSDMPFSMHGIRRVSWMRPSPTLTSACCRHVHPWHHRSLSIGELSRVMCWPKGCVPRGPLPFYQIAKGVCPPIGEWLARMVVKCLDDEWGGEEWTVKYDEKTGTFDGSDSHGMNEKVIDVTRYRSYGFDVDRYPVEARQQFRKFNVDETGHLVRKWSGVGVRAQDCTKGSPIV